MGTTYSLNTLSLITKFIFTKRFGISSLEFQRAEQALVSPAADLLHPPSISSNLARPVARRLDSSRPRPISSIRSPRRNPERRLRSVEHHLGPSVLATISGTASALCSPGVPATVAAVLLCHSPLWPATSTTRTLGISSPCPPFVLCEAVRRNLNVIHIIGKIVRPNPNILFVIGSESNYRCIYMHVSCLLTSISLQKLLGLHVYTMSFTGSAPAPCKELGYSFFFIR